LTRSSYRHSIGKWRQWLRIGTASWISVFYHRALCHRALALGPRGLRFVTATGPWIVGIDPKAWVCMHRRHHDHSDAEGDPHSPLNHGVLGVAIAQLRSYERILSRLMVGHRSTSAVVDDLDFPVHGLYRRGLWWLPYALHMALAVALGAGLGWPSGLALMAGLSSHPLQGWMVNSLAHRFGGRGHDTGDNSRNNRLVALLCFGEGLQNNHHFSPDQAKFSSGPWEVDFGWWVSKALLALGLVSTAAGVDRG